MELRLANRGIDVRVVSGDGRAAVETLAKALALGSDDVAAEVERQLSSLDLARRVTAGQSVAMSKAARCPPAE